MCGTPSDFTTAWLVVRWRWRRHVLIPLTPRSHDQAGALMLHSGKLNDTCRPMGRRTPPEGFPKLAGSEHVIIDPSGEMKDLDGR